VLFGLLLSLSICILVNSQSNKSQYNSTAKYE